MPMLLVTNVIACVVGVFIGMMLGASAAARRVAHLEGQVEELRLRCRRLEEMLSEVE